MQFPGRIMLLQFVIFLSRLLLNYKSALVVRGMKTKPPPCLSSLHQRAGAWGPFPQRGSRGLRHLPPSSPKSKPRAGTELWDCEHGPCPGLTLQSVALDQIVVVTLRQDPGLHPAEQPLQVAVVRVEAELVHDGHRSV